MKKAVLLSLGVAAATSGAFAQQSIMFQPMDGNMLDAAAVAAQLALPQRGIEHVRSNSASNKTTDGATGEWFSYVDLMYGGSGVGTGYFWEMQADSTFKNPTTANPNASQTLYGLGVSFDPTSGAYSTDAFNAADVPDFVVEADDAYRIDSFYTFVKYMRQSYNGANTVDTLQIDLVKTTAGSVHARKLQFQPSAKGALFNQADSILRFADATYDRTRNQLSDSIPAAQRFRYKLPLTAAFFADSSGGTHDVQFAIPGGMMVDSGQKVVAYFSYKNGRTYPNRTLIDSTNHIRYYTYLDQGASSYVRQFGKDYTHLLWANIQAKYTGYQPVTGGPNMLIPIGAYAATSTNLQTGLLYSQFYVTCTQCDTIAASVKNVANTVKDVTVVPNPANEQVEVRFALGAAAQGVTVTLTNPMGQVVAAENLGAMASGARNAAKFNTSRLPAGVYFYSVEAAGTKSTGRVVVTH